MAEIIEVNTYEHGLIRGEIIKIHEHLLVIKTEEGEYLKVLK